jgi:hypothetical protein
MTDIKLLNDPDYRWYHKEEMSKIMPYVSIRKQLGIAVLSYDELRYENDSKILVCRREGINWSRLRELVESVPIGYHRKSSSAKKQLQPADSFHFEKRDAGICYICGSTYHYGSNNKWIRMGSGYKNSQLHHVLPDGGVSDCNIKTLCVHCHQIVHQILFVEGRWKFTRPT